ncbi:UTP--glucose-1-phosphate uridylyltransferase [Algimonas ampicilliniresistens]|uniref:UTP--glucose-1-phosphate uridylyltransferase n=1 Tax=Algimonas ampicilliniresistens TaxID=1298735 RepID=A0ABQ5VAI9_9PROT|nr:UTP--glucose-1-phosphate uridylyltransferase GalU [Algimonas ampicilliniresistens]GLQ24551.1 UTP--glucose-1-phosphate uridylyltransferase [Algimonas ampicilliniresistens]
MKPVRIAVMPVAGFGTRVLPATKTVPKEMLPVVDRPALQYVVDEALEAGIEHIVFITGRNKGAIEDYFDEAYELEAALDAKAKTEIADELKRLRPKEGTMSFVRQQSARGLGHAVWCARDIVGDQPFAVLLPDVIIKGETGCLQQMMTAYSEVGGNIIAVDEVPEADVSKYGVIAPKGRLDGPLIAMSGMVEKPAIEDAPSRYKITGRYILQPDVMDLLATQDTGAGGEIQLTDAMARAMDSGSPFHAFAYAGQDYDCGSKLGYFEAVLAHALTHPEIADGARALVRDAQA